MGEGWQCRWASGFVGVWRWPVEQWKASAWWQQGAMDVTASTTAAAADVLDRLRDIAVGGRAIGLEGMVGLFRVARR